MGLCYECCENLKHILTSIENTHSSKLDSCWQLCWAEHVYLQSFPIIWGIWGRVLNKAGRVCVCWMNPELMAKIHFMSKHIDGQTNFFPHSFLFIFLSKHKLWLHFWRQTQRNCCINTFWSYEKEVSGQLNKTYIYIYIYNLYYTFTLAGNEGDVRSGRKWLKLMKLTLKSTSSVWTLSNQIYILSRN